MTHRVRRALLTALSSGLAAACGAPRAQTPAQAPAGDTAARAWRPTASPERIERIPLVPTPDPVRGLYVNRWAALGQRMWQLIDVAKTTEVNALVIDVKDDRGFVLYKSRVPLATEIGADTNMPMSAARVRAVLDTMRAHGI